MPASPDGRLEAAYIADSHVLVFESLTSAEGSNVVNIDNCVILDALDDGRIVSIEVMYERGQWTVLSDFQRPKADDLADIALSKDWLSRDWVELPVVAETNPSRDLVLVRLAELPTSCIWVELSTNCLAAVLDDRLLALYAALA